jgi:hypothetical protein
MLQSHLHFRTKVLFRSQDFKGGSVKSIISRKAGKD